MWDLGVNHRNRPFITWENRFPSDFFYRHPVNCSLLLEAERLLGRRGKCDEQQIWQGDHNWHKAPSETVEPKSHAGVLLCRTPRATSLTIKSPSPPDKERFSQVRAGRFL
ncbi:MAG: hypothetical protein JO235_21730 [Chroococcidiopsidaceae cyanobacterium CP_BM_RX_35]|nr:hypothetical protein [Chroococcidiopsidaceae cyanobacterium CP_BM_RX_35]